MHRAGAVLVCVALLAACASGGTKPGAATSSPGGASGGSKSSSGSSAPTADPSLSAFRLLDKSGYTAALGEPVVAVEDDGGFPDPSGGHRSVTRVATTAGEVFDVTLHSAADESAATTEFRQLAGGNAGSPTSSLPGLGDESVAGGGKVFVRKGAQVLTVEADLGGQTGIDLGTIKANGGDPTAVIAGLQAKASTLAAPLASKLTGQTGPGDAVALPDAAIDPCAAAAIATVEQVYGVTDVRTTYEKTANPPTLGCVLEANGLPTPIEITTVTDTQLASAVSATSAAAQFQSDGAATQGAATSPDAIVSPLLEYNEVLETDPFGWIIQIGFPGTSRDPCSIFEADKVAQIQRGEEFVHNLLRAMAPNPPPSAATLQRIADDYQKLADMFRQQAESARSTNSSCK